MTIFQAYLLSKTSLLFQQLIQQLLYLFRIQLPSIVFSKVMNLQSRKSPRPDGWPTEIIKLVRESVSLPLFIIFTKSFNSAILLHDWKSANVTPIHKKGTRNLVSNYRPVSLTSVYCKLMESIIKDHIIGYLMDNNLVLPQQFGFIPGRSCTTQFLHVLDTI